MSWVAEHRTVFTYAPNGTTLAVVTGYDAGTMFVVEHVIVFPHAPSTTLLSMARAALVEAWTRYATIVFCLPTTWRVGWPALSARLGFVPYADDGELTWYCAWKP